MHSADEVIRAAKIISSALPTLTQELLSNHRRELQFAFDRLKHVLRSEISTSDASQQQNSSRSHGILPREPHFGLSDSENNQNALERTRFAGSRLSQEQSAQEQPAQEQPAQEQPAQEQPAQEQPAQGIPVPDELSGYPAGRKRISQEDYLSTIMVVLDRHAKKIKAFTNKSEAKAVLYQESWTQMDPLEVDIQLSLRGCSLAQKFRGILARYIFADKYLDWAEATYKLPRASFLLLDGKDADCKRKGSYIGVYLDAIKRCRSGNQRSVQIGVKLHSFEHIYGKAGTFAFLFHVYSHFRALKYSSLKSLAELIRKSSTWSELAETREEWYSNCVSLYKKDCAEYRRQRGQKRPIDSEGLEESQSKRAELDFTTLIAQTDNANIEKDATTDMNASIPPCAELNPLSLDEISSFQSGDLSGLTYDISYDPFASDFGFLQSMNGNGNLQPTEPGPGSNFTSQENGMEFPLSGPLSASQTVC